MESLFAKYGYTPDKENISKRLDAIAANIDNVTSPEVLKNCMALMDLTTLHTEDTPESVKKLVGKVNSFMKDFPEYPLPASVCVFPNFASVVRESLVSPEVHVTAVAGCFPTSHRSRNARWLWRPVLMRLTSSWLLTLSWQETRKMPVKRSE